MADAVCLLYCSYIRDGHEQLYCYKSHRQGTLAAAILVLLFKQLASNKILVICLVRFSYTALEPFVTYLLVITLSLEIHHY